jgi:flagella basal body P-ring formation protein FlgA
MRSFGSALALAVAMAASLEAQGVPRADVPAPAPVHTSVAAKRVVTASTVPVTLAAQVTGAIAHQWGDDSSRLQLTWGMVPGAAGFPPKTEVRVLGRGDGGWFTAVFTPPGSLPFAVRVRAGAQDSVTVAARTLDAGRELGAGDLQMASRTRWGPPADAATPRVSPGWITRRLVMTGADLNAGNVAPPPLVRVGDQVRLEWRRGAVLITLDGTALDAGGAGQTVRVRVGQNPGSKNGIVLSSDLVRLDS